MTGLMAFIEDATRLMQAQQSARESEERYRLLFQSAPVAMIERDASVLKDRLEALGTSGVDDLERYVQRDPEILSQLMGLVRTVDCNRALLDLLEVDDKNAFLEDFPISIFGEDQEAVALGILLMVHRGAVDIEREMSITTLRGRLRRVIVRGIAMDGHGSPLSRVVISMIDISKRMEAEEALRASERRYREMALRDNLTGLYNRRHLYQALDGLIEASLRERTPLSVLFMDLDHFKQVVDTHGHLNGSRVIKEVAATIRRHLREPAFAVAYAGDEFIVVLPGSDSESAAATAREILGGIGATAYLGDAGESVRVQVSAGIATCPRHAANLNDLLAFADRALFQAKATEKGSIRIFTPI